MKSFFVERLFYNTKNTITVYIKSLDELKEIADMLGKPILIREYDSVKYGRTKEYVVIDGKAVYIYRERIK